MLHWMRIGLLPGPLSQCETAAELVVRGVCVLYLRWGKFPRTSDGYSDVRDVVAIVREALARAEHLAAQVVAAVVSQVVALILIGCLSQCPIKQPYDILFPSNGINLLQRIYNPLLYNISGKKRC